MSMEFDIALELLSCDVSEHSGCPVTFQMRAIVLLALARWAIPYPNMGTPARSE